MSILLRGLEGIAGLHGASRDEAVRTRKFEILYEGGSDGKEFACNAGDPGSIPGLRRSPGEGHGNPLQYSCMENSMNRGAWRATVKINGWSDNKKVSTETRYRILTGEMFILVVICFIWTM